MAFPIFSPALRQFFANSKKNCVDTGRGNPYNMEVMTFVCKNAPFPAFEQTCWRSIEVVITSTTGNRVAVMSGTRVRIPPSPPKRKVPCSAWCFFFLRDIRRGFERAASRRLQNHDIINARLKRKGKALPKPERLLTATVVARCAPPTWCNNLTAFSEAKLRTPERTLNHACRSALPRHEKSCKLTLALIMI